MVYTVVDSRGVYDNILLLLLSNNIIRYTHLYYYMTVFELIYYLFVFTN